MRIHREGQAWVNIDGTTLSVYEFEEGVCYTDFVWWPSQQRQLVRQAGRTLAKYHQAVSGLEPMHFKWDAYRPRAMADPRAASSPQDEQHPRVAGSHVYKRWREASLYQQSLGEIRSLLRAPRVSTTDQGPPAEVSLTSSPSIDAFARSHLDEIERLLDLESVIERRSDLPKVVIHGDYTPWNLLLRPDRSFFVLDFNAARLDLRIFDVILATFWFAWRQGGLDQDRAMAFQTGYCSAWDESKTMTWPQPAYGTPAQVERTDPIQEGTPLERPSRTEIALASDIFQWLMGRSIAERLRCHYLERRLRLKTPTGLERFYQMCTFAAAQPRQLTCGLDTHGLAA
jgi:thiamine kinase-like enzyme